MKARWAAGTLLKDASLCGRHKTISNTQEVSSWIIVVSAASAGILTLPTAAGTSSIANTTEPMKIRMK